MSRGLGSLQRRILAAMRHDNLTESRLLLLDENPNDRRKILEGFSTVEIAFSIIDAEGGRVTPELERFNGADPITQTAMRRALIGLVDRGLVVRYWQPRCRVDELGGLQRIPGSHTALWALVDQGKATSEAA